MLSGLKKELDEYLINEGEEFHYLTIFVKQTLNHMQLQDVPGCLQLLQMELGLTLFYIHCWKVPEPIIWMCKNI